MREALIECVMKSPCWREQGRPFRECVKPETPGSNPDCQPLRNSYMECKRGQIDMRKRFSGNTVE